MSCIAYTAFKDFFSQYLVAGFPGNLTTPFLGFLENFLAVLLWNLTAFLFGFLTTALSGNLIAGLLRLFATGFLRNLIAGFLRNLTTFLSGYLAKALPRNLADGSARIAA